MSLPLPFSPTDAEAPAPAPHTNPRPEVYFRLVAMRVHTSGVACRDDGHGTHPLPPLFHVTLVDEMGELASFAVDEATYQRWFAIANAKEPLGTHPVGTESTPPATTE